MEEKECWNVFELNDVISSEYIQFVVKVDEKTLEEDIENVKKGKDRLYEARIFDLLKNNGEVNKKIKEILKENGINVEDLDNFNSFEHSEVDYVDFCDRDCNCAEIEGWIDDVDREEKTEKIIIKVKIYSNPN